ncbi:transposase, MuDR, MULE transposase domain protein [Tanacetum coccineum]
MEDQPLPADASSTTLSPGYIADSDPEEDEEDPEEDPADYPVDGGDNDDNESSNDDDDDNDVEKDEEDEEEKEEHLAPADASVDFEKLMTDIHVVRPDAHQKLVEAGVEKWSWAKFPANRYNYMTSNSVESINALTKTVRKIPITSLMDWFRQLLQDWYYERQQKYEDTSDDDLTPWASAKIKYRYLKSSNWSVRGILKNDMYQVRDNQGIHTVYLKKGECTCRRWQLSGLPCGHVCAVARVEGLTSVNQLAKPWFLNKTIKGTYTGLFFPVTYVSTWEIQNEIQQVLPPYMGKKQSGRPKKEIALVHKGRDRLLISVDGVVSRDTTELLNMVTKKQKSTQQA